ncbi:Hypothetical predicted protein [Paramuricea clavata]|uniref:Uncharacterized protein n=1 Tax=Paramuricea clavata TaxID=317549 RepID=A0A7D9IGE5_PARCT|nr:Hypothetical predicted protein [Paramuricea clavata]
MTVVELILRYSKYESAKMSYWRSEERRRLLGITGYGAMANMSSRTLTLKVLTLIGQKYNVVATSALNKEIVLARKFIREKTTAEAKKLKDFWGSFYQWKLKKFPSTITREEWQMIKMEDQASYPEYDV